MRRLIADCTERGSAPLSSTRSSTRSRSRKSVRSALWLRCNTVARWSASCANTATGWLKPRPSKNSARSRTRTRCPNRGQLARLHRGQLARRVVLQRLEPAEQRFRRDAGTTDIETGTELIEQFGLAERQVGVTAGAAHLLALDPFAIRQLDRDLVIGRGADLHGVVILVRDDGHAAHQLLDLGPAYEFIGVFAEAGAPGDDRSRHRDFHAEHAFAPGLRLVVAQDQRMRVADRCGDPRDLRRLQRTLRQQIEHPVERAVGAVAGRVFLDAEALLQDMPFLT